MTKAAKWAKQVAFWKGYEREPKLKKWTILLIKAIQQDAIESSNGYPIPTRAPIIGIVVKLNIDGVISEYATFSSTPTENILTWVRGELEKAKKPSPMRQRRMLQSPTPGYPD